MSKKAIKELHDALLGLDENDSIYRYEEILKNIISEIKEMKDQNVNEVKLVHIPSIQQIITDSILPIKENPINTDSLEYTKNTSDIKRRVKFELGSLIKNN